MELKDYTCIPDNSGEYVLKSAEDLNLKIPDCYRNAKDMARLSLDVKKKNGFPFVILPFCHTVESEAFGGLVNYGDFSSGPRCGGYRAEDIAFISESILPDVYSGRTDEVIRASKFLSEMGETVLYELSGPFTVLNGLLDAGKIFKAERKNPSEFKKALDVIEGFLLEFSKALIENGVSILSYADSAGALNITGPKVSLRHAEDFTVPFLKKLLKVTEGKALIHLCPKVFWLLESAGFAKIHNINTEEDEKYGEIIRKSVGRVKIMGDRCLNLSGKAVPSGKVRELILL